MPREPAAWAGGIGPEAPGRVVVVWVVDCLVPTPGRVVVPEFGVVEPGAEASPDGWFPMGIGVNGLGMGMVWVEW